MTQISSHGEVPELLHNADDAIGRADGNSDEHGEDEAVEEVAESDAGQVRVLHREPENVGQECFDALTAWSLQLASALASQRLDDRIDSISDHAEDVRTAPIVVLRCAERPHAIARPAAYRHKIATDV